MIFERKYIIVGGVTIALGVVTGLASALSPADSWLNRVHSRVADPNDSNLFGLDAFLVTNARVLYALFFLVLLITVWLWWSANFDPDHESWGD